MGAGRPKEDLYEKWIKGKEDFILAACRDGASVEDLCKLIGCKKTLFHQIKKIHPEFLGLLKEGRAVADYKVEAALFKRACGFEYEEKTTECRTLQDGSGTKIISVKKTKKIVPPDTGAAMAWLKNRMPDKWRDRHEGVFEHKGNMPLVVQLLNEDAINEIRKISEGASNEDDQCI